ncbi:protein of unknown function DUF507 [Desulfurobacterium thermolithotrophum DSM 11699]|uniref:DUF507 domain-containing protein n=1 Tax=Desulfurobacterium thermolithotrophum (strain DSM 11699 / BSA) TaxID=868864 RepID=F0S3A5_DESTD|nr:DUF507 family protein [Desulfurobacterium thermolithotrophum]ADY73327.1 protein of unknown function DUF507 [Desulfurobacterium thermolithotrophum DSM 11699]
MAKQNKFLKLLADRVANNLLENEYVIADNPEDFKKKIYEILYNDYIAEKELEEEAEKIIQENAEEVTYRGVSIHKARKLIKERLAKEKGISVVGSIFSREKANYLAGKILRLILTDEELDYTQERGVIRSIIVKSFEEVAKLRKEIDKNVREKIASHSRPIYEGTPEWYALYRRYYNEELIERGLIDAESEV